MKQSNVIGSNEKALALFTQMESALEGRLQITLTTSTLKSLLMICPLFTFARDGEVFFRGKKQKPTSRYVLSLIDRDICCESKFSILHSEQGEDPQQMDTFNLDMLSNQKKTWYLTEYENALNTCDAMLLIYTAKMAMDMECLNEFLGILKSGRSNWKPCSLNTVLEAIPTFTKDVVFSKDLYAVPRSIRLEWIDTLHLQPPVQSPSLLYPIDCSPLDAQTSSFYLINPKDYINLQDEKVNAKEAKNDSLMKELLIKEKAYEEMIQTIAFHNVPLVFHMYISGNLPMTKPITLGIIEAIRFGDSLGIREVELYMMGGVAIDKPVAIVKEEVEKLGRDFNPVAQSRTNTLVAYLSSLSSEPHIFIDMHKRQSSVDIIGVMADVLELLKADFDKQKKTLPSEETTPESVRVPEVQRPQSTQLSFEEQMLNEELKDVHSLLQSIESRRKELDDSQIETTELDTSQSKAVNAERKSMRKKEKELKEKLEKLEKQHRAINESKRPIDLPYASSTSMELNMQHSSSFEAVSRATSTSPIDDLSNSTSRPSSPTELARNLEHNFNRLRQYVFTLIRKVIDTPYVRIHADAFKSRKRLEAYLPFPKNGASIDPSDICFKVFSSFWKLSERQMSFKEPAIIKEGKVVREGRTIEMQMVFNTLPKMGFKKITNINEPHSIVIMPESQRFEIKPFGSSTYIHYNDKGELAGSEKSQEGEKGGVNEKTLITNTLRNVHQVLRQIKIQAPARNSPKEAKPVPFIEYLRPLTTEKLVRLALIKKLDDKPVRIDAKGRATEYFRALDVNEANYETNYKLIDKKLQANQTIDGKATQKKLEEQQKKLEELRGKLEELQKNRDETTSRLTASFLEPFKKLGLKDLVYSDEEEDFFEDVVDRLDFYDKLSKMKPNIIVDKFSEWLPENFQSIFKVKSKLTNADNVVNEEEDYFSDDVFTIDALIDMATILYEYKHNPYRYYIDYEFPSKKKILRFNSIFTPIYNEWNRNGQPGGENGLASLLDLNPTVLEPFLSFYKICALLKIDFSKYEKKDEEDSDEEEDNVEVEDEEEETEEKKERKEKRKEKKKRNETFNKIVNYFERVREAMKRDIQKLVEIFSNSPLLKKSIQTLNQEINSQRLEIDSLEKRLSKVSSPTNSGRNSSNRKSQSTSPSPDWSVELKLREEKLAKYEADLELLERSITTISHRIRNYMLEVSKESEVVEAIVKDTKSKASVQTSLGNRTLKTDKRTQRWKFIAEKFRISWMEDPETIASQIDITNLFTNVPSVAEMRIAGFDNYFTQLPTTKLLPMRTLNVADQYTSISLLDRNQSPVFPYIPDAEKANNTTAVPPIAMMLTDNDIRFLIMLEVLDDIYVELYKEYAKKEDERKKKVDKINIYNAGVEMTAVLNRKTPNPKDYIPMPESTPEPGLRVFYYAYALIHHMTRSEDNTPQEEIRKKPRSGASFLARDDTDDSSDEEDEKEDEEEYKYTPTDNEICRVNYTMLTDFLSHIKPINFWETD